MGRLFWKLFLVIAFVQMVTVVSVGYSIVLSGEYDTVEGRPPPPGDPAPERGPPRDFGPEEEPGSHAPRAPGTPGSFHRHDHGGGPGEHHPVVPPQPIIGGLVASAITAALLAWFMAKPIRSLRDAFTAAAGGDLDVRIAAKMGRGKDELTDLGRDFDRMVERLQTLIVGQRRLLHDVSHEMRSPLARMQAAIGLASQRPDSAREALDRIERESVRMDRLIGELLALARLQAGFTGKMDDDIDLRELLDVIIDDAALEARARGRSVTAQAAADGLVRGNAELLRRALDNVVRNAIKYSRDGGAVTVHAQPAPAARTVLIAIGDSGPGVPESDLAAIFEPFYRGTNGGSADGHGLGLAIAKRIIEAHAGTIRAENRAGGGLRVEITLPVRTT
jgi:signal transduction histidine kinase